MKVLILILGLMTSFAYAQSKAGFYVVGGKIITVQDTSSQKYLKAIEGAGNTNTILQNFASNFLVTSEKAIGSYSLMAAQYPFIGGTSATHSLNMNNPNGLASGFTLTFDGGGWVHSFVGIKPNGASSFANTYLNESTQSYLNNKHVSIYSNSNIDNGGSDIGTYDGFVNTGTQIFTRLSNDIYLRNSTNGAANASNTDSRGYYINNRILSNTVNYYKNGINVVNSSSNSISLVNKEYYIGAAGSVGYSTGQFFSNRVLSYASIGQGFSAAIALAQSRIVEFTYSILGRSVNRPVLATYFGDSITQGYDGSTVLTNNWVNLLSTNRGLTATNKGISGTTMQNTAPTDLYGTSMRNRFAEIITPTSNDAYLFIAYGVNDCRVSTNYTASIYGTQLGEVIDNATSKGWALNKIKVLTPYLITDFGTGDLTKLLAIRTQAINVSATKGVQSIDVYSAMSVSDLSVDNIHPSATGYQTIANYINSVLN